MSEKVIKNVDLILRKGFFKRPHIRLNQTVSYIGHNGREWRFQPPQRFDGHSVPMPFTFLFRPYNEAYLASMAHDEDCKNTQHFQTRLQADKNYLLNCLHEGEPAWAAYGKYIGVSLCTVVLLVSGKLTLKGDL